MCAMYSISKDLEVRLEPTCAGDGKMLGDRKICTSAAALDWLRVCKDHQQ